MDANTRAAKKWLEQRYRRKQDGSYLAHQPIDGLVTTHSEPNIMLRLTRTYHVLRLLEDLPFDSFLDVGGGEGYVSALVRDLYDATCCTTDLSHEACLRATELFGIQSFATDATRLPFKDRSYDLVFCSEVIEHLSQPVWAISELVRVARKYVVITTAENCPLGELERTLRLSLLDTSYPHAERNWFTLRDFQVMLGEDIWASSQMRNLGGRVSDYFADKNLTRPQIEKALDFLTSTNTLDLNHDGIVVVLAQPGLHPPGAGLASTPLTAQRKQQFFDRLLGWSTEFQKQTAESFLFDQKLLPTLQCPRCQSAVEWDREHLVCSSCAHRYSVQHGVPLLTVDEPIPNRPSGLNPIELLSKGDAVRTENIRALTKKLHGNRPERVNSIQASLVKLCLRLLFLLGRPESIGLKVKRVMTRLRREPPIDYKDLEQLLLT